MHRACVMVVLLGVAESVGGCASTPGYVGYTKLEPGTPYWVAYDANRRGGLMLVDQKRSKDGVDVSSVISCSEPPPDAAGKIVQETSVGKGYGEADAKLGQKTATDVVVLSKRSEDVEVVREAFFRLCELSLRERWAAKDLEAKYEAVLRNYSGWVTRRAELECYRAVAARAAAGDKTAGSAADGMCSGFRGPPVEDPAAKPTLPVTPPAASAPTEPKPAAPPPKK